MLSGIVAKLQQGWRRDEPAAYSYTQLSSRSHVEDGSTTEAGIDWLSATDSSTFQESGKSSCISLVPWAARRPAALILALLVLVVTIHRSVKTNMTTTGPRCHAPDMLERSNASFWKARVDAQRHKLIVEPRAQKAFLPCPPLAEAFFSIHLDFADGLERRILSDPTQAKHGQYTFDLVAPLSIDAALGDVTVRLRLDLDYFPGGRKGLPCGVESVECEYRELMQADGDWRGTYVKGEDGRDVIYRNALVPLAANLDADSLPLCAPTYPLLGAWRPQISTFIPLDAHKNQPCHLLKPDSFSVPARKDGHRTWLHFIGDSNTRHFVPHLASKIGLGSARHYFTKGDKQHAVGIVAWNDRVVVTFAWWFMRQHDSPHRDDTEDEELEAALGPNFGAYLRKIFPSDGELPSGASWPWQRTTSEAPDLTYINFGSHAPRVTAFGTAMSVQRVEPVILKARQQGGRIVIATTTTTDLDRIPHTYIDSKIMRNDVMLRATNEVVVRAARERWHVEVLDWYGVTRTVGTEMNIDVVHFKPEVYRAWADILLTALQGWAKSSRGGRG